MYKKFTPRAKTVKEEPIENIADFSENKELYRLKKARSPHTTVCVEKLDDPWFVYVLTYRTKSGIITDNSMMLADDIPSLVRHLERIGWEIQ